jgi:hypothetical protein
MMNICPKEVLRGAEYQKWPPIGRHQLFTQGDLVRFKNAKLIVNI